MNHRFAAAFLTVCTLSLPMVSASAQTPYSPASPLNTSNPFGGISAPQAAPARPAQMPVQAAAPGNGLTAVPGGFMAASAPAERAGQSERA